MEIDIVIFRFMLTFILSLAFGIQRQLSHKQIGFGTFIFVAIGSCALSVAALTLNFENSLPLLGAIVTGIGFLGAGALVKSGDRIFGFTSAASIWIFSILGLIIGIGQYISAAILYAMIWIVIFIDMYFEKRSIGSYRKKIHITSRVECSKNDIKEILGAKRYKTLSLSFDYEKKEYSFVILAESSKRKLDEIPVILSKQEDIVYFRIE